MSEIKISKNIDNYTYKATDDLNRTVVGEADSFDIAVRDSEDFINAERTVN